VVGLILFGLQAAVLYLYLFNRATRQSIHDVLADTYVVKASVPGRVQAGRIWKGHWVVLLGLLVVAVVISTLVAPKFMQMTPFAQLRPVLEKILDSGKVHGAQVFLGKSWGTHGESKYVHAQVTWKGRPENSEKATDEIAAIVIETYPQIMEQDLLVVTVSYGYDIGIASAWKSYTASYTPKEWQDRVKKIRVSPQQS